LFSFAGWRKEQGRGGAIFDQTEQRRIEFFSRVDPEREERKFFPFSLVKLLDAD
jgi:hypothetical protein